MSARKPARKKLGTKAGREARRRRGSTHARIPAGAEPELETKGTRASKGRRIDWIIERMSRIPSEWNAAARQEYMRVFDVALPTCKVDAAEASRMVERTLDDPQLKRRLEVILDETLDDLHAIATSSASPFAKVQALRERRETVQTFADLRGVSAPKKVDVGVQDNLAALIAVGLGGGPAPGPVAPAAATPGPAIPPAALGAAEPDENERS